MGKTWKRNDDNYEDMPIRESRKEAKARKRRDFEYSEEATLGDRRL